MCSLTKAIVAMLSVCLFFGPLCLREAVASTVSDIDGSSTIDVRFDYAGEHTVNLTIPQPFKAISAQMNITGLPLVPGGSAYPRGVSVDVGNDGKAEWAFNGTGYGSLGRQDRFSDNTTMTDLAINNHTSKTYTMLVPSNARIEDAGMTLEGIPTPTHSSSLTVNNDSIAASANKSYIVNGIKDTDLVINTTIGLTDLAVVQNRVDVNQSVGLGGLQLTSTQFTAQSFRINRTDPRQKTVDLYNVEVAFFAQSPSTLAISLDIENTTQASDYKPVGDTIGGTSLFSPNLKDHNLNFTFYPPLKLEPDKVYSMVLGRSIQGGMMSIATYHEQVGGDNSNSKYPVPGCYMHVTNDGGYSWTTYHERDWMFRTHVGIARPIASNEVKFLEVDGKVASTVNGKNLFFNQTPRYNASGWNFTLANQLPLDLLYNMSAKIKFNDAPDHVAVDVGDDGTAEYSNAGNFSTVVQLVGLKDAVASAVDCAVGLGNNKTDAYENNLVPISIKVSANGQGNLRLENIFVLYNFTERLPGLKEAIIAYSSTHMSSSPLKVPLKVKSSSSGIVRLSDIKVVYDGAPRQVKKAPSGLSIPEEGMNTSLVDIKAMFQDDYDTQLALAVHNFTTSSKVNGGLNISIGPTDILSVDARKADNWTGLVSVIVNATDSSGLTAVSEPINITVTNVDDAPVITTVPPMFATVGKTYFYNFTVVDCDNTTLSISLEKAPKSLKLDEANRSIRWTPAQTDVGIHDLVLKVSDGLLEAAQNISIMVRPAGSSGGNRPPIVQDIPDQTTAVDINFTVKVTATDPDLDPLRYSFVSGPTGMTVNNTTGLITWRPDKADNYTSIVRVSDGIFWVDVTFNIKVNAKDTMRPNITISRPLSGEKVDNPLTLIGTVSVKGGRILKVEYSIDNGAWAKADLQSDGSWSAEASISDLKVGSHNIIVRATDSNGQMAQTFTTFEKKGAGTTGHGGTSGMQTLSYILLVVAIIVAVVASVVLTRMRRGAKPAKTEKRAIGNATKEAGIKSEKPSDMNSAFLVYHDGRLITYSSMTEIADLDATLQVIKDFVKASFRGEVGRLDSLRYENMNIILERGVQMYLVVITSSEDDISMKNLRRRMRTFLGDVHERYKHILKVWDGKFKSVKPVEKMVVDLVHDKWTPSGPKVQGEKEEEAKAPAEEPKKDEESKRWDESPDLEGKDLSTVEKKKLLQDRLTRGEISEKEFERLSEKLR